MVRPRWRRRLLVRAGALALGALVAFVVLELFVRAFVDLAAQRAIPVHGVDPENPVSFLPGFAHTYETPEFTYTVRFNSWGRRDVEWTEAAIADPESVLLIGDSFVLGNGLEHEDTIASGLERFYASHGAPREVLNFGLPGGGPAEYARLFEDGLARGVAARTVVVVVFVPGHGGATDPRAAQPNPKPS